MAVPKAKKPKDKHPNPFRLRKAEKTDPKVHVFGNRVVCDTEKRGHARPKGRSPLEIVVDASEGFIPLWSNNTTLRWRFREQSMQAFENPSTAKTAIRKLFGKSLLEWGDAAPVKFAERGDAWDFEIVMRKTDDCDTNGCVLASAFFPVSNRHRKKWIWSSFSASIGRFYGIDAVLASYQRGDARADTLALRARAAVRRSRSSAT